MLDRRLVTSIDLRPAHPLRRRLSSQTLATLAAHGAEADGEAGQAVDQRRLPPAEGRGVAGEGEVREAVEQGAEGDLPLEPGQRGAKAVVYAVAEGEVAARVARDVQPRRVAITIGIAVGRDQRDQYDLPLGDGGAADLDPLCGVAEGGEVDRAVE